MTALDIKWKSPSMTHWYWALIDDMLLHPELSKRDFAPRFNVSVGAIYSITSSDAFRAAYAQRRQEFSAKIDEVIINELTKVARESLTNLNMVLEKKKDTMPAKELAEIADKALERLGYGVRNGGGVQVNVNAPQTVMPVARADLEAARETLREQEKRRIIDVGSESNHLNSFPRSISGELVDASPTSGEDLG